MNLEELERHLLMPASVVWHDSCWFSVVVPGKGHLDVKNILPEGPPHAYPDLHTRVSIVHNSTRHEITLARFHINADPFAVAKYIRMEVILWGK